MKAQLARFPLLYDMCVRIARKSGKRTPIYDAVSAFIEKTPSPRILQIGANDGIENDPIREFIIRDANSKAILIEPIPDRFDSLVRNYSYLKRSNLLLLNVAVSDRPGQATLYRAIPEICAHSPGWLRGVISSNKEIVLRAIERAMPGCNLVSSVESIEVNLVSAAELVNQYSLSDLDIMVIDVEGYEKVILCAFPFEISKPGLIIYEYIHLNEGDRCSVTTLLSREGYRVVETDTDCIATLVQNDP